MTDHNFPVKGKFIEILGSFDPENEKFEIKKDRVEYWLKAGSKVSQTAMELLKKQKVAGKLEVLNRKDRAQVTKKGEEAKKPEVAKPEAKKESASAKAPADKEAKPVEQKEAPKKEESKPEAKKETPKSENKPKVETPKTPEQAK